MLEAFFFEFSKDFASLPFMKAMRQAHGEGWFYVIDTNIFANERIETINENANGINK